MEIARFVQLLRARWLAVLACVALGTGAGLALPLTMTPVYEARAQTFITLADASAPDASLFASSQFTMSRLKSYTMLVGSPGVLGPVIADLGLGTDVATLRDAVTASNPSGSFIISVTAQSGDPATAAAIANAVSERLGTAIEDLEASSAGAQVSAQVVREAEPPASPTSPRRKLALALGLLAGLAVGLGLAAARQQLDRSVRTAEHLKQVTGAGVLTEVPLDPSIAGVTRSLSVTESFRTLRASLRFVDVDHPPRVIAVSSAVVAEGKTSTAVNLAASLAASGSTVCLVDADLRRPGVSQHIGILDSVGLSDTLIGEYPLDDVLVDWEDGVTVLPAGTLPPDPAALLGSQAMTATVAALHERFDFVILDTPPLTPVVDGAVLGALADGTILVVRHGSTDAAAVARAAETLDDAGARLLGTVLNRVPRTRRRRAEYSYVPRTRTGAGPARHADGARADDAAEGAAAEGAAAGAPDGAAASSPDDVTRSLAPDDVAPSPAPDDAGGSPAPTAEADEPARTRAPGGPAPDDAEQQNAAQEHAEQEHAPRAATTQHRTPRAAAGAARP
ncbi:polysaccharide biosynthesis tyrosine autokinase [Cellulomonas iranensis]|uniref:polysaccharide biosynthesis tyrosine autokinase n=1 Tax=Cellulomonas iranensis TaxID=76862 RepID=UPI0015C59E2D|nr:polysaccharide biosynthesis tyrosine autokinase [Cellulomonas iranensis]